MHHICELLGPSILVEFVLKGFTLKVPCSFCAATFIFAFVALPAPGDHT